jgi:hypothetical protein
MFNVQVPGIVLVTYLRLAFAPAFIDSNLFAHRDGIEFPIFAWGHRILS